MSKKSKLETFKENSRHLRGQLATELHTATDHFDEEGKQLLKFHGIYQQDDRDQRKPGRARQRAHQFMVRSRIPGGQLTAEQYLVHDGLAEEIAEEAGLGALRITTRQGLQFHGVAKGELQHVLRGINEKLVTSLGACGDLVRNVMCCPEPQHDAVRTQVEAISQQIADHVAPRTRAYHEVWLDDEKVYSGADVAAVNDTEEPLYGATYLPRKFKLAIAYAGDNCVDIYTQDLGLIALTEDAAHHNGAGERTLVGFNVLAGGGLGMTHNKPETFPRLGDPIGFVTPEHVVPLVAAIVGIHRDFGDRGNRKHARLKYVIHDRGVEWFKAELATRLGFALAPFAPMPALNLELHLGWHEQGDGHAYLGLSVENGRVVDSGSLRLKSGLAAVIERFRPGVRLTPNQDILLTDLRWEDRAAIEQTLADYGIPLPHQLSSVQLHALACPALPTCGLALAEAERSLPPIVDQLEVELAALELDDEKIAVRMTGCPNGCARPYVADLAFVGRSLDKYVVLVGGHSNGTRLNQPFADLVPTEQLVETVRPLFVYFKHARHPGETFGDFCARIGIDGLQRYAQEHARGEPVYA